jgi:tetratricopeptide (TPR) repeat protein
LELEVARAFYLEGNREQALAAMDRARAIADRSPRLDFGWNAVMSARAHLLSSLGREEEAAKLFRRTLALSESLLGAHHPRVVDALAGLGHSLLASGRGGEAQEPLERALALAQAGLKPGHELLGAIRVDLGDLASARQQPERALALYRAALQNDEHGSAGPARSSARVGGALVELGRAADAIAPLEAAVGAAALSAAEAASARWYLAQALLATGGDRARARSLAEEARAGFAAAGGMGAADEARVAKWLRENRAQARAR